MIVETSQKASSKLLRKDSIELKLHANKTLMCSAMFRNINTSWWVSKLSKTVYYFIFQSCFKVKLFSKKKKKTQNNTKHILHQAVLTTHLAG